MDRALVLYHAYCLLAHGGSMADDCELCDELATIAEATEAAIQGTTEREVGH